MSSPAKQPARDPVTDLATKIYIELICRNAVVSESTAQVNSNPENLAKISFQLAEAFQRVSTTFVKETGPKNVDFDMQDVDLGSWNLPKT